MPIIDLKSVILYKGNMVCLLDIKESTVTVLMWIFTVVIAVGIFLVYAKDHAGWHMRECIGKGVPLAMLIIGFLGSVFIGVTSDKKREGFKAIFGV